MSAIKMYPKTGFTLVELLIVIVVIAILAAISIVAYNGIQTRAYDSRMFQGAKEFEKALKLWAVDYGDTPKGNSGAVTAMSNGMCADGGGAGFVASGIYLCTTEDMLTSNSYLPKGFMTGLPTNPNYGGQNFGGRYSLMLYKCGPRPGSYALLWSLRKPSPDDTANLSDIMSSCPVGSGPRDSWGMRAARIIQL